MKKTILITGATDGIGLETAKRLAEQGHDLLIHGRSAEKLKAVKDQLAEQVNGGVVETLEADFSDLKAVRSLAEQVLAEHAHLDVLINNAGVYKANQSRTGAGLDVRFAVNTLAPVALTKRLLPIIPATGRIVNLSSAAQSPVDVDALAGRSNLDAMAAYAQSKLALTMWTRSMATAHPDGPLFVAVNPGSLLGTKMVKEGWGMDGKDVGIGADILVRAALHSDFEGRSGDYFDNDSGAFASPHHDAMDDGKVQNVMAAIETVLNAH